MKGKHLIGIDLLKIISATLIVFHHYQQDFHCRFPLVNFFGGRYYFGNLVELFFIISGFVTLTNYKKDSIFNNLKHKLLRFYPMSIIACLFTLIVESTILYIDGETSQLASLWTVKVLVANLFLLFSGWHPLTMLGINNPTWYLCILIQCFLVFFLILKLSEKFNLNRLYLFLVSIALAVLMKRLNIIESDTYRGLESFFLGTVLCEILSFKLNAEPVLEGIRRCYLSVMAIIGCVLALFLLYRYPLLQRLILLFGLYPCLIVIAFCSQSNDNRIITTLGRVSFEVFIWHYPFIAFEKLILKISGVGDIFRSYWTMFTFTLIVWIISSLLYHYLEKPLQKMLFSTKARRVFN
ncbi:MAG: acyltransferase, partial [Lachnospiraceae bacterium]|nr:acyltransferase [Lachnospiraceae bacterium]